MKQWIVYAMLLTLTTVENVGLNSFKNKKWLMEETVNKLPFEKNVAFEVAISNEANGFQVRLHQNVVFYEKQNFPKAVQGEYINSFFAVSSAMN